MGVWPLNSKGRHVEVSVVGYAFAIAGVQRVAVRDLELAAIGGRDDLGHRFCAGRVTHEATVIHMVVTADVGISRHCPPGWR